MFASNLERLLFALCQNADATSGLPADMPLRFESLRNYGHLPKGRENRSTRLTNLQIAHAILGLVPSSASWAGHSAVVLGRLQPVGGTEASLKNSPGLASAIEVLLTSKDTRAELSNVQLSMAESGRNSSGLGVIILHSFESVRQISFVPSLAVSLLQPGAEKTFDPTTRLSPAARQLILNRAFFDQLVDTISESARWAEPAGDGAEYEGDDAQRARFAALGVVPQSRFLNFGVDTQATWPKQETLVEFDKYRLVLMPRTADHTQSVHIDLFANRLSDRDAMTVVNRFLSVMAWCTDQFAISEGGWSGNPVPVAVARQDLAFATTSQWIFDRTIPETDEVRRALAHYREGCNAEEAALISYAVLSYYKILELRYPEGKHSRPWIAKTIATVLPARSTDHIATQFYDAIGAETAENYLWTACRTAVAHASVTTPSDADDAHEILRLHIASRVLRRLARHLIATEMGLSESVFAGL